MSKRFYQAIAFNLMTRIADGDYPVGMPIPGERRLAADLGVSRPMIREAMIVLEVLGIVEPRLGSGNFVIRVPEEKDWTLRIWQNLE